MDLKEVWNTAKRDINSLKMSVEKILSKKDKNENND